ncbi:uncharacterized protein LOC116435195 [Nomia melanderi]|uniref:uncharacterized protein LOC116435195 n=1 Tax=Nomia melanderi TaxID=2448451 RepID=UPI003FCE8AE8
MCRLNFRIKVDLCKFYNDVRRFCWIFVDGSRTLRISHAMEHISKLFNIKEPFHLVLNQTEYLPPNEDIRVLKENETILVCPGTGLECETETSEVVNNSVAQSEVQNIFAKTEVFNHSVLHKESQTNFYPNDSDSILIQKSELNEAVNRSQTDVLETSMVCERMEDEQSSTTNSKVDGSVFTDFNVDSSLRPKRKRTRSRKKKAQEIKEPVKIEIKAAKPKIIDSFIISTNKHIRFDSIESPEMVAKQITPNKKMNGSYTNEATPSHKLANLLSLGQNSTPITFTNSQVKEEIKIEHVSDEDTRPNISFETNSESKNFVKALQEGKELTSKDLETCPPLITKPELKSILAFKMLKIGADYTPQVSEFIVAEVISYCPASLLYTFKIMQGILEVQVPVGKFTLIEDDEEQTLNDTITINIAQLIEPRIVSMTDPNGASTPVNNCSTIIDHVNN